MAHHPSAPALRPRRALRRAAWALSCALLGALAAGACAGPEREAGAEVSVGPAADDYRFAPVDAPPALLDRHLGTRPVGCGAPADPGPEPELRRDLRRAAQALGLSRDTRQAVFARLPPFLQDALWR